jgi:hypothetical protein
LHEPRRTQGVSQHQGRKQFMAKSKDKKGSVKVQDMGAKKNPKGGATTDYLKIKLTDANISSAHKLDSTLKVTPSALKIK